ncbi:MAG: cytochrome P450 [Gemmatimonadales bacterium]
MIATLGELVVLAVGLGLAVRVAVKPPVRQELAPLGPVAVAAGVAALGLMAIGTWAVLRWPELLHLVAGAVVVGSIALWWRARPTYGRRRGWPPGSLGIAASIDAVGDRDFYRTQARRHGPVFKMSQFGRPVVCVVGLARGREILQGQGESLAGAPLPYNRFLPKGMLRYMTAEDHRREAAIFRSAFAGIGVTNAEAAARAGCRRILAELAAASSRAPEGVRVTDYWAEWAADALARLLFGVEPGDPRGARLDGARRQLELERTGGRRRRLHTESVFESATETLRELGREPVPGTALSGLLATDPAAIDDPTRIRNLFLTYRLGTSDLTGLLDWVVAKLAAAPEWADRVRRAPRTPGPPNGSQPSDLASRIVLETLRMEQSEYLYRRIVRPITIAGYAIPAGWLLRICVQESHRDPAVFPDPDRFDPDRFVDRTYSRAEYAPFGIDTHGCLGVTMVHFLGRIFVEELCHGYQMRVTHDGALERGSRHRHHWRPSSVRRLVLVPNGAAGDEEAPGYPAAAR